MVELPTTGLVLASTVSGEGDNPTDMILLGLDGNGRTMWGRECFLHGKKAPRAVGWPGVRLTDDGGILLGATAATEGTGAGDILAMKLFARDGSLPDESLVSSSPITPKETDVPVESRDFTPALASPAVTVADYDGMLAGP